MIFSIALLAVALGDYSPFRKQPSGPALQAYTCRGTIPDERVHTAAGDIALDHPDGPPRPSLFGTPVREAFLSFGRITWKLNHTGSYPILSQILVGRLTSEKTPDVAIFLASTGCGLAASRADVILLLSRQDTYLAFHLACYDVSAGNFIDYRGEGICFLQTEIVFGPEHNYWVHRLLRLTDLQEVPSFGLKWIRYTYRPNHKVTHDLTPSLKKWLWSQTEQDRQVEPLAVVAP